MLGPRSSIVSTSCLTLGLLLPAVARADEILIEADQSTRPPDQRARRVHGEFRLGARAGFLVDDPFFSVDPSLSFDLRDITPLQFRLGADIRLRMVDLDPEQDQVIRGTDWDEPGDYVAILQALQYIDSFAFGRRGQVALDLRVGGLARVQLGHGSVVGGYANSLDVDRRRTGVDFVSRVEGELLDQVAGVELGLLIADLAMQQPLGARLAFDWASAGLGFTVVGDPLAPRTVAASVSGDALAVDRQNRIDATGDAGVVAAGVDLSYTFYDSWRYWITPYLDLNTLAGLGSGLHLGLSAEFALGRRRAVMLGFAAEFTYGSSSYDPVYFDVFYTMQRSQGEFIARADQVPTGYGALATTKYGFVALHDLGGPGGHGVIRFAHTDGAFAETGYRYRPGPQGHTWETRVGVELPEVSLSFLHAHRGELGFDIIEPRGSLVSFDLLVPVVRFLDVSITAGYLYATRRATGASGAAGVASSGFVGGAAVVLAGVAGRVPW
ncbi:MAG: hypothetical protein KC636_18775 [Myxococcales bacterium]|nr:hypothetical protein [Myxococcales bacterium]